MVVQVFKKKENMEQVVKIQNLISSKEEIIETANQIVELVNNGEIDALEAQVKLTALENAVADAKKAIKENVMNEAAKYGSKTFEAFGAQVQIKSTKKYDYSVCPSWVKKNKAIEILKEMQKGFETQLKAAKPETPFVDAQTGEVIESIPYKSSETISIIFK